MKTVLVIGAGPAGLSCARRLTEGGMRVTLVDKSLRPGGKACAGGLTKESWEPAGVSPNSPLPGDQVFESLRVGNLSLRHKGPFVITVDRRRWQGNLMRTLREAGVEVELGVRVERLNPVAGVVRIDGRERRFDVVVGADGAASLVRRTLGLSRRVRVWARQLTVSRKIAAQKELHLEDPTVFFEPELFKCGYAWIFPRGDDVRIGCGASSKMMGAGELGLSFGQWMSRIGIGDEDGRIQSGSIGCDYQGHRFGRVFLAGDAAGLASPVTGEGIGQALVSGEELAREILEPGYRSSKIASLAARHRRTHSVLAHPRVGSVLFKLAPLLLRFPPLAKESLLRFG